MKTSQLIKENNILREQLSSENKKYYENLIILVRLKSIFRREEIYEETLLAIVQDLLEAQNSGQTADKYLGNNIYQLADEIVDETSYKNSTRIISLIFSFIGLYLLFSVVGQAVIQLIFSQNHQTKISLAGLLLGIAFTLFISWLLLKYISNSCKTLKILDQKFITLWLKLILPSALIIGVYVLISYLTQNIWLWTIHF